MNRFQDKVIVITGGGSGLGRLCGQIWAAEGAKVVVTDLIEDRTKKVAAEITDAGGTAIGMKADVTIEAEMEAAVKAAVDAYGRLDIMFANAGCPPDGFGMIALEDLTHEQWRGVNRVVFDGVYYAGKYACRQMKTQKDGGNIVVTVSAGGHNAYPGFGAYCAGKAGALGLVRSMAYDWGRYGIRVNGLSPTHGMSVNFRDAARCRRARALVRGSGAGCRSPGPRTSSRLRAGTQCRRHGIRTPCSPGRSRSNRPPSLKDNAAVATFLASDDSCLHVRHRHPVVRRRQLRPHLDPDPRELDPRRPALTRFFPGDAARSCSARAGRVAWFDGTDEVVAEVGDVDDAVQAAGL